MKKGLVILIIVLTLLFSFSVGYYLYKVEFSKYELAEQNIKENTSNVIQISEKNIENDETKNTIIQTNAIEEKVSPNATLIIKKYYKKCGHTTKDYAMVPEEMVNKTRPRSKINVSSVGCSGVFNK